MDNIEDFRFPVGKFHMPKTFSQEDITERRETISEFPNPMQSLVNHIPLDKLQTPYREKGWNAIQVIYNSVYLEIIKNSFE